MLPTLFKASKPNGRYVSEKEKVRCKQRTEVPVGFAEAVLKSGEEVVLRRTFIDVQLASSLRSAPSSGIVTASTTDVHMAEKNPRAA